MIWGWYNIVTHTGTHTEKFCLTRITLVFPRNQLSLKQCLFHTAQSTARSLTRTPNREQTCSKLKGASVIFDHGSHLSISNLMHLFNWPYLAWQSKHCWIWLFLRHCINIVLLCPHFYCTAWVVSTVGAVCIQARWHIPDTNQSCQSPAKLK